MSNTPKHPNDFDADDMEVSYYEQMEEFEAENEEDTNPVIDQIIEDKLWP
jgi:hypothetical protein